MFEGEFKNSMYNGQGKETWQDSTTFKGVYKNGRRNGKGVSKKPGCISKWELWKEGLFI